MSQYDLIYQYLANKSYKISTGLVIAGTSSIISFSATTASYPVLSGSITGTVSSSVTIKDNFLFFINGQYVSHNLFNMVQSGSVLQLVMPTESMGYPITSEDEIIGWGRFA